MNFSQVETIYLIVHLYSCRVGSSPRVFWRKTNPSRAIQKSSIHRVAKYSSKPKAIRRDRIQRIHSSQRPKVDPLCFANPAYGYNLGLPLWRWWHFRIRKALDMGDWHWYPEYWRNDPRTEDCGTFEMHLHGKNCWGQFTTRSIATHLRRTPRLVTSYVKLINIALKIAR